VTDIARQHFWSKCYVEIIKNVVDGYEDKSLNCLERIEKIWYANFFFKVLAQMDSTAPLLHIEKQFYHAKLLYVC